MIRTLVIDDDFRVARIHAASVERIDGFECVGEAHSAAEARTLIEQQRPDLLILDIYLPDEDGLSLLRSLTAAGQPPDTIFITAARDLESVRAAMGLGAVYYLVKPFGFAQLRNQLEAYRQWRDQVAAAAGGQADQARIDTPVQPAAWTVPIGVGPAPAAADDDQDPSGRSRFRRADAGIQRGQHGRGQPADRPALPDRPAASRAGRPRTGVRQHRSAGAPLPGTAALRRPSRHPAGREPWLR